MLTNNGPETSEKINENTEIQQKSLENLNEENDIDNNSETINTTSYMDQVQQTKQATSEPIKYPISWGKQIACTVTTTAISFLPIALKLFNEKSDSNNNPVTFDDLIDVGIYKLSDVYSLMERITYGTLAEKWLAKGKIVKIIFPLIPTIKNIYKQYKNTGNVTFSLELASHIIVFLGNTIIPYLITNPYVNYAFDTLFKGSLQNMIVSNMMRSRNPLIREVGNFIPMAYMMGNKIKNVANTVQTEINSKNPQTPGIPQNLSNGNPPSIYQTKKVDYNVEDGNFKKMVDGIAHFFQGDNRGYNTGYNGWNMNWNPNYYDPYYNNYYGYPGYNWNGNSNM